MICRHKLYHFTVANTRFTAPLTNHSITNVLSPNFRYRIPDDTLSFNNQDFENPVYLEFKDTTESNTSDSYLYLLLSICGDVQFHTFLYEKYDDFNFHITHSPPWVTLFHLRQPLAFLSHNLFYTPQHDSCMNVLFRGPRDFQISFLDRDMSVNDWSSQWESFWSISNNVQFRLPNFK